MTSKNLSKLISAGVLLAFLLAGCNLPTVTPPPEYNPTVAPTTTAPIPATAMPATVTPAPIPTMITAANVAQLHQTNKVPTSNVASITWSTDSATLGLVVSNMDANGYNIYSATLLDGKSLAVKTVFSPPDGRITDISPDGRLAAVVSADMTSMSIYDLGDGNKDIVAITPGYLIGNVTFSPDGTSFALTKQESWEVVIHSLPDGSEVKTLTGFETAAPVFTAGFKGSSTKIVWVARATAQVQDIASGNLGTATNSEDFLSAYTLSPDGKILATAAEKTINGNSVPAVTLWSADSGAELLTLALAQSAQGLAFSADGSLLAVAEGNDVQMYEVGSGTLLATLSGHSGSTSQVAFSPDGLSLVSTGQDNQLILWQVTQ
jgi:WD40 repeat protein